LNLDNEHNFKKYGHGDIDSLNAPYDFESIMHYGNKDFTNNGKDTIVSISHPGKVLGQRTGFSKTDIFEINALYDCSGKTFLFLLKLFSAVEQRLIGFRLSNTF
jgi:hypothetical protein